MTTDELINRYLEVSWGDITPDPVKREKFRHNYLKTLPASRDAKILDIGPGRGEMLSLLREAGYRNVEAIDVSEEVVQTCRKLLETVFLVDDAETFLSGRKDTYDMVVMLDVLEHIPKQKTIPLLCAIAGALKEHGILLLQFPNMSAIFPSLHHFNCFTHEVGFSEHSIAQVLKAAGFQNFTLHGFEEIIGNNFRMRRNRLLRDMLYWMIRGIRRLDGGLNPHILHPVFFAVVTKP